MKKNNLRSRVELIKRRPLPDVSKTGSTNLNNADPKTLLEYARYYVSKGFSVIPLMPRDKKPAVSWTDYQNRKPTEEELVEWFSSGEKNIGIVTGKISGIVVIDLDSDEAQNFAKSNHFPPTPNVITRKGYHLYYAYPQKTGVRNFQKRDGLPNIDLRGDGGYVVAPPSVHPDGHIYQWCDNQGLEDLTLGEPPRIILAEKDEQKKPLKELYRGVPESMRNESMTRIVGSLVNDGLTFEECLKVALSVNERNIPPMERKEVEGIVKSIYEKHLRERPVSQFSGHIYKAKTKKVYAEDFDPRGELKKGHELKAMDCRVEWVIEKLLPKQSITLLHGKGGVGKTWLSLLLAKTVSEGDYFMGLRTEKTPVYYIDFENSLSVLIERIRKLGADDVNFWHFSFENKPPKIDSHDWDVYKKLPQGLITIDTYRAFQSGDENDSQQMSLNMEKMKELRELGFTILLLHHTPKSNERIYKGSTAIFDLSDHILSLYRVKKQDSEDEDEGGSFFRFGTKDKTRYEPFHFFVAFDPDKGFVKAADPDEEDMKSLQELLVKFIKDKERPNQSELIKVGIDELMLPKSRIQKLLRKGEGKYWTQDRVGLKNQVVYSPIT